MNNYAIICLLFFFVEIPSPDVNCQTTYKLPEDAELILGPIKSTFSCQDHIYGYYADVDNDCKIFHICHPIKYRDGSVENRQYSFYCGNQTVFDQRQLLCTVPEDAVKCTDSGEYHYVNQRFRLNRPVPPNRLGR